MFPILNLGPLAIQVPGLILLAGIWLALTLIEKEAPRRNLETSDLNNLILLGLVAGIVGARLWYAVRFLDVYLDNPLSLFSLNPSTLALWEGILTGIIAAMIYGQRKGLPLWPTLDAVAPGLAVFAVALGFSHLASGDAFGAASSLPWSIELWGERRHPSQVYEILAAVLVLVVTLRIRKWKTYPGFTFLAWVALTSLSVLILGAFRGDSVIVFETLRRDQVIALAVLMAALLGMHLLARREASEDEKVAA
ncbi:MAG: hypothetical protein GTO18_14640 [Anaerolineales bacterium]|nr:hypothetical protein [Anaerolineales bacterium]